MKWKAAIIAAAAGATLALAVVASASSMNAKLGARLSGMGEHGTVNLKVTEATGKVCWTFDVPMLEGATRATVNVGQSATVLFEFGMDYSKAGCATESKMTLQHLEAKPSAYSVWVDTKAHPGEVRGALFAGMASM
jgi:hypothetical protein